MQQPKVWILAELLKFFVSLKMSWLGKQRRSWVVSLLLSSLCHYPPTADLSKAPELITIIAAKMSLLFLTIQRENLAAFIVPSNCQFATNFPNNETLFPSLDSVFAKLVLLCYFPRWWPIDTIFTEGKTQICQKCGQPFRVQTRKNHLK